MPDRSRMRPRDANLPKAAVVDIAMGQAADRELTPEERGKNPAAVALGRLGGIKGGKARAAKLSPEKRVEIARRAASARWKSDDD